MQIEPEHMNMFVELLKEVLKYSSPAEHQPGWKSKLTLTYVDDEKREMEKIVKRYDRNG